MDDVDIWAATALDEDTFAISLGEMEDDPQYSKLCIYSVAAQSEPRFIDFDSTLVSLTPLAARYPNAFLVALGIDGDVHFIGEAVRTERIPEAGSDNDNGEGRGSMSQIKTLPDGLVACGYGSQVYLRNSGGNWNMIAGEEVDDLGENSFEGVAVAKPGSVAACGFSDPKYRVPTPEEQAELDHIAETGSVGEYTDLADRYLAMIRPAGGCLYILDKSQWRSAVLPGNGHLNDVDHLPDGRFLAAGGGGMIVAGRTPEDLEEFSEPNFNEIFCAVRVSGSKSYLLGESCIVVLSPDLRSEELIPLPDDFSSPLSLDVVGDIIWYFDHKGVARRQNGVWTVIDLPREVWQ
ncbi:hypothetical protein [Mesorhizobium sp.]|uniref:hypothetical protein n=1 Tax=Mesorhizobium sp. TaxID=1871066 RepID=UPI000FE4D43F|nr:hypothetical protein [Mesorhizobium sp.]RWO43351.1 MAG: hypothetical protein EOS13_30700 [Mesorhizobium sp.]TIN28092.1 MAG: hypothetical protein E5Y19_08790 [Mesorhizobium sp.]TIN33695.1 MAG: hypothetical protein E5Y13_31820 [Mesorhizobium sp.]TJU76990.1 MAG: hypothetical protein E5Y15_27605 [Mesorhizobium sp.]TJU84253.1 MAG: hypothetical protein E5Y10_31000 [Mesorhizobium sp.]